jgi:serine/threonine protein kinase
VSISQLTRHFIPLRYNHSKTRSILTLPKNKYDHTLLAPVDPRSEDVYSLGVLIWRTFSGKSPWSGAIEDDIKTIRYIVSSDHQIQFNIGREVEGPRSRELLFKCLTAQQENRSTAQQLKEWLDRPQILKELVQEFEAMGAGRKRVKKNLD